MVYVKIEKQKYYLNMSHKDGHFSYCLSSQVSPRMSIIYYLTQFEASLTHINIDPTHLY